MAILPPWHMLASMSRKASGLPDISRPMSKPSFIPSSFWTSASERLADVDGQRRAHLPRQLEAVGIDVGDHDVPRAGVADDRGGHDPDRPGAGDQHVLAQHGELTAPCARRCRTGRRSAATSRGRCSGRGRQTLVIGSDDVFGERARPVDADALGVRAEVPPAGQAVAAAAADDVALAADDLAGMKVRDVRADLDDLADELVADHHRHGNRLLRPGVPVVDVHVGAADAGPQHANQHVVDARFGHRHLFEPKASFGPAL